VLEDLGGSPRSDGLAPGREIAPQGCQQCYNCLARVTRAPESLQMLYQASSNHYFLSMVATEGSALSTFFLTWRSLLYRRRAHLELCYPLSSFSATFSRHNCGFTSIFQLAADLAPWPVPGVPGPAAPPKSRHNKPISTRNKIPSIAGQALRTAIANSPNSTSRRE
jgi:hypothetical protein